MYSIQSHYSALCVTVCVYFLMFLFGCAKLLLFHHINITMYSYQCSPLNSQPAKNYFLKQKIHHQPDTHLLLLTIKMNANFSSLLYSAKHKQNNK